MPDNFYDKIHEVDLKETMEYVFELLHRYFLFSTAKLKNNYELCAINYELFRTFAALKPQM